MDRWIKATLETDPEIGISIKAAFMQIHNGKLCVLLGLHKKYAKYMLLGGRGEINDLGGAIIQEDILARELKEELGLRIWDIYPKSMELAEFTNPQFRVQTYEWLANNKTRIDICYPFYLPQDYLMPFDSKNLPETSEIDNVIWLPIEELEKEDIFDNTKAILRGIKIQQMQIEN